MQRHAIELCDRALALASEGRVLSSAPSAVFSSGDASAGAPAWNALRLEPTRVSTTHWRDLASPGPAGQRATALVMAELRQRLQACPLPSAAPVWIAAPAALTPRSVGRLLGIADALRLPVEGFADATVVSAAALALDRSALALDLGLHDIHVTALEAGGPLRRRGVASSRGGLIELFQAWLALIGRVCMRRTRFDPLHDAPTEQKLFDALPRLAADAVAAGEATAVIEHEAGRLEVSLTRDQLAEAGEPFYGEIVRLLHGLRPAGAPLALLVPRVALALPGLAEALHQFHRCELVALADGFAAAALSTIDLPERERGAPVRLLRRLPAPRAPRCEALVERHLLIPEQEAAREPTHVLLDGKTYALGRTALAVGRRADAGGRTPAVGGQTPDAGEQAPDAGRTPAAGRAPAAGGMEPGARGIMLANGLAGVSRLHCTLVREAGETVLVDHSRFGTLVNGERVRERVRVHAGDRIRLGEPGVELLLIAVAGPAHGRPPGEPQATPPPAATARETESRPSVPGAQASHASEHHAAPAQN